MNIIRKLLSKNKTDISFSTTSEPNNAVGDITNALDGVPFEPDESEISRINETIETITTDIVSREKSSVDADNVR